MHFPCKQSTSSEASAGDATLTCPVNPPITTIAAPAQTPMTIRQ
jgi:hypothetical protein